MKVVGKMSHNMRVIGATTLKVLGLLALCLVVHRITLWGMVMSGKQCVYLTEAEKDAFVALGWTLNSGPYTHASSCLANCVDSDTGTGTSTAVEVGPVTTVCCGGTAVPSLLYAHLSGASPSCACLEGTYPLNYNSTDIRWESATLHTGCSTPWNITLECNPGDSQWYLGGVGILFNSAVCSPFSVSFPSVGVDGSICGGAATVTVVINTIP